MISTIRSSVLALFAGAASLSACNLIAGLQRAELIQVSTGGQSASSSTGSTVASSGAGTGGTGGGSSCTDGVEDGQETDLDCGGPVCDAQGKTCAFGKKCQADADCATCFCNGATCDALTLGTAQSATGVAVDATSVYWTDTGGGLIAKAPSAGGGPSLTLAFGQSSPAAIALDATNVYWTTLDTVMSVPLNGGAPATLASGQNGVAALAVDATQAYWNVNGGTGSSVVSSPLGGGTPTYLASGMWHAKGIAVDATSLYWTTFSSVLKATIGLGQPSTLASADEGAAIVVSGGKVYWTEWATGMALIASAPTDSDGGAPTVLASEASTAAPLGLAVDSESIYWTDAANGTLMKAPIGGGTPTPLASGQSTPSGIALDQTYVYWAAGTAVKKVCK